MTTDLETRFKDAQERVQTLPKRPGNDVLLDLYALFKQGSVGDAQGKRPSIIDLKGRAKFDSWSSRKGMSKEAAMQAYVDLVDRLLAG